MDFSRGLRTADLKRRLRFIVRFALPDLHG